MPVKNSSTDETMEKPPSPRGRGEEGLAEVVAAVGELTRAVDRLTRMTFLVQMPGTHTTPTGAAQRLAAFWQVVKGEEGQ